jgi:predicted MFS family arabinose efflux permease
VSWRAIFFINIPIAAVTLLIVWRTDPTIAPKRAECGHRLEWD